MWPWSDGRHPDYCLSSLPPAFCQWGSQHRGLPGAQVNHQNSMSIARGLRFLCMPVTHASSRTA